LAQSKEFLIVAGPNGSGKTTFALEYVAQVGVAYLGADAIAEEIAPGNALSVRFRAGRQFLAQVNDRLAGSTSFAIETTLSGVGFRQTLSRARRSNFTISIVYLYLDSADTCISRIQERVRKGGHHVPDEDVRRRFDRSIRNFWKIYRDMADNWVVLYNAGWQVQDVAAGSRDRSSVRDTNLFGEFMRLVEASDDE